MTLFLTDKLSVPYTPSAVLKPSLNEHPCTYDVFDSTGPMLRKASEYLCMNMYEFIARQTIIELLSGIFYFNKVYNIYFEQKMVSINQHKIFILRNLGDEVSEIKNVFLSNY